MKQFLVKSGRVALWVLWTAGVFYGVQYLAAGLVYFLHLVGIELTLDDTNTLGVMLYEAGVYLCMLVIAVGAPLLLKRQLGLGSAREVLGLARRITWSDVGEFAKRLPAYYVIIIAVTLVLSLFSRDILTSEQAIGYATADNSPWQLGLIFLALVVIAPVAEELIMRGMLYGRLRSIVSFWPAAVLTSLLFGLAHLLAAGQLQIGVAVDTFVLSMLMCGAREKTGTLYAPILMHMSKNLIAFILLFLVQWSS
jgi:membrane protease YdiL (CAAX protease family)